MFMSISIEDYLRLEAAAAKLQALEAFGVDNWDGYDAAMESLEEESEED